MLDVNKYTWIQDFIKNFRMRLVIVGIMMTLFIILLDLVVSDYGLPKFSGEEVYRRVKELRPAVLFLLISGYLEPEKKESLLALGIADIIAKPFKPTDLLTRIRKGLDT